MKRSIFITLCLFLFFGGNTQAQNNTVAIHYTPSGADFLNGDQLDGAGSYDVENFKHFGLLYYRNVNEKWSIKTGFEVSNYELKITSAPMPDQTTRTEDQTLYTLPLAANYKLNNWFSLESGLTFDIPKEDYSTDSQFGLGFEIGPKFTYKKDNWSLNAYPNFSRRGLVLFDKERYHHHLTEAGLQFSAGYSF